MAFNITFTVGAACKSGGEHFPITATRVEIPAQTLTVNMTKAQAVVALTNVEREQFLPLLIRFLLSQAPSATNAQLKTALETTTVNLTLNGF